MPTCTYLSGACATTRDSSSVTLGTTGGFGSIAGETMLMGGGQNIAGFVQTALPVASLQYKPQ